MKERRREPRIPASSATFAFVDPQSGNKIPCRVLNLSRLGIGIELPDDYAQTELFVPGVSVNGFLTFGSEAVAADAFVRVRREKFAGLEFDTHSHDLMRSLLNLLSPAYIGASIRPIAKEYLSPDIEAAYRGDEFECIVFKPGRSVVSQMIQIFAGGSVVEIFDATTRFVPAPLVRTSGKYGGFDFLSEFAEFSDDNDQRKLRSFFDWVERILSAWPDCPPDLRDIVSQHGQRLRKE